MKPGGRRPRDPLEHLLASVWQEVLGRSAIPIAASFAELGGTPALATAMFARVEAACERTVPPWARTTAVTIERLARALKDGDPSRPRARRAFFARNVPPAPGAAPPLFFLHGDLHGGGFYCLTLAGHLGRDQPFYALPPHGVNGDPIPPTVETMATAHLVTLRSLQAKGPYRLGGHCNGALVAFEMARRLHAEGETVQCLLLIAPIFPPPAPGAVARLVRRVVDRVVGRVLDRARYYVARVRHGRPLPRPPADEAEAEVQRRALYREYTAIMRAYHPGHYDGPVTILWPREEPAARRRRGHRVWTRTLSRLIVVEIPGDHRTCVITHARALGQRMQASLADDSTSACASARSWQSLGPPTSRIGGRPPGPADPL